MSGDRSQHFDRLAIEARQRAARKGGGRDSRIAGHLALAYEALAKAKRDNAR